MTVEPKPARAGDADSPEPQPSVRLEREEIARIIDGEAFSADPEIFATAKWGSAHPVRVKAAVTILHDRRAGALAKADAIISSARSGGES